MGDKYKPTKEFLKKLGLKILNTKEGFIAIPVDEYLRSIGSVEKLKISANNVYRSIEESINKVGPADYYFKVIGINKGEDFKISLIPKEPWVLKRNKNFRGR